jgi:hypothetical protein
METVDAVGAAAVYLAIAMNRQKQTRTKTRPGEQDRAGKENPSMRLSGRNLVRAKTGVKQNPWALTESDSQDDHKLNITRGEEALVQQEPEAENSDLAGGASRTEQRKHRCRNTKDW